MATFTLIISILFLIGFIGFFIRFTFRIQNVYKTIEFKFDGWTLEKTVVIKPMFRDLVGILANENEIEKFNGNCYYTERIF